MYAMSDMGVSEILWSVHGIHFDVAVEVALRRTYAVISMIPTFRMFGATRKLSYERRLGNIVNSISHINESDSQDTLYYPIPFACPTDL